MGGYEGSKGSANENNEEGSSDEGDESHEKESVHHCTRTHGKGYGFEGRKGAHRRWLESHGPHEEQAWQDCQQEEARLKCKKPLDGRLQGTGRERILRHWR